MSPFYLPTPKIKISSKLGKIKYKIHRLKKTLNTRLLFSMRYTSHVAKTIGTQEMSTTDGEAM